MFGVFRKIFSKKEDKSSKNNIYGLFGSLKAIQAAIHRCLKSAYSRTYSRDISERLAAAIVNEIFFSHSLPEHDDLYKRGLVHREMQKLKEHDIIKEPYTQAIRIDLVLKNETKVISMEEMTSRFEKCKKLGIFLGDILGFPETEEFIRLAQTFDGISRRI